MIPQSGIVVLSENVQDIRLSHKIYHENHEKLEIIIKSKRKTLVEVKILRGIFQRDALSHLLFVIAMMPLNYILK